MHNTVADRLSNMRKSGAFESTLNVRNNEGLMQTFSRLIELGDQYSYEDPDHQFDPTRAIMTFSQNTNSSIRRSTRYSRNNGSGLGVSGASNLRTMDALDISISAAAYSLIPYLAIERAMPTSATNISYQDIVADQDYENLKAGEVVLGAFSAPNTKLNMAFPVSSQQITNTTEDPVTLEAHFNVALMPETISVQIISSSTVIANGIDHSGKIYFTGAAAIEADVNYKTGTIIFKEVPPDYQLSITTNLDSSSDVTGQSILNLSTDYKNVTLVTTPRQLVFRDNNLKNSYLNKLNVQVAGTGLQLDYGEMAIGKLINIYIQYINRILVNDTIRCGNITEKEEEALGLPIVSRDISNYMGSGGVMGYADTKFDYLKTFIIDLNQRSLDSCGRGITTILVGSRGANLLVGTPYFAKSSTFDDLNNMIGTFDGIPVVRHQLVDQIEPPDHKTAYIYGIYKDPSGSAAPIVFGEFLPVRLTDPVSNFNNPEQIARSMTSYCGTAICVPRLCHKGAVTFA